MDDSVKITGLICLCVVAVVSALVVGNIYSPATPARTALQICASEPTRAATVFCVELAKNGTQ
jgi:hypothetical protein